MVDLSGIDPSSFVPVPEASRRTGVRPDTLRKWIKARRFGGTVGKRLGRAYVVNVGAVEEIIRSADGGASPE